MTTRTFLGFFFSALALSTLAAAGCGGSGNSGGSGGSGGSGSEPPCPGVDATGCDTLLVPGDDDTTAAQTALIEAKSGSTVCFCPGSYSFTKQLSLTVPDVTVKGIGDAPDDTILDFAGNTAGGNDTMLVTADGFTIENLWVKNTPGNGVVVRQADSPTFRKLKVSWDSPLASEHGAYAVYPAECTNVLIEDCDVAGAADAAIYVGQGTGAVIRRNKAHDSVLGIELENTTDGEAYDNEVFNNSAGLAVFLLGNLTKKTAERNLLHHNDVRDNNHVNFGDPQTVVSKVPVGTGVIVIGADDTEIRDNTITDNESVGVMVISYQLMEALVGATPDPGLEPDPERTFIHSNTYMNNGTNPRSPVSDIGAPPIENVLWDGIVASGTPADNNAEFCLTVAGPWPSFRMFDGANIAGTPMQSTDTTPYQCDLPPLPSVAEP
jgi:parallel beta-helix repeat protein